MRLAPAQYAGTARIALPLTFAGIPSPDRSAAPLRREGAALTRSLESEGNVSATISRTDVYTRVTERIIADLQIGVRPWAKSWNATHVGGRIGLPLRHNGEAYRGVNILLLWGATLAQGFSQSTWMTYRQATELNAHVRKGQRGSLVVYANRMTTTRTDENGEDVEREISFLKAYTVFNVEQIDGLPEPYFTPTEQPTVRMPLIEHAEAFFANTGAVVRHAGNRAYYSRVPNDVIVLPVPESFRDAESYSATKAHEFVHWTAASNRLDRSLGKRFGDDAYAAEELIAELGAAFLCAVLGISAEPRDDHASYLAHWLQILQADNRAIFTAATLAQRAVDYLHALQPSAAAPVPC
jgi:antirestriction protein ArdC